MARRLPEPNRSGGTTDHSTEIQRLRERGSHMERRDFLVYNLAADLLVAHDESGIALDNWKYARDLVELLIGQPIVESGV